MMIMILILAILLFTSNCLILYLMVEYLGISVVFTKDRRLRAVEVQKDNEALTVEEKRFKERSEKELAAFQELMNYNAGVAYGIAPSDKETDK